MDKLIVDTGTHHGGTPMGKCCKQLGITLHTLHTYIAYTGQ